VSDRVVPLEPLPDPLAPAKVAEVDALGLPERCKQCTFRRQLTETTGLSFGYCDKGDTGRGTCDGMIRNCLSCKQDKPQKGWGLGFASLPDGLVTTRAWVCPDCPRRQRQG
jgi:hypothetical protein